MKLLERLTCLVRRTPDLEHLFTLKDVPVSMYCVNTSPENDQCADMVWSISKGAGCVQLSRLVPLNILYEHEHGSGVVGGTWRQHHAEFCAFIASHGVERPIEVGAGHGLLAQQFLAQCPGASWVIVEPNLPEWRHDRVEMVRGLFDADFALPTSLAPVDSVVHSHTFEHIYDPRAFLEAASRFLKVGQKHIFSLPRLDLWLERQYSNALNFEHTVLLTEGIIEELLRLTGFEVIEKRYFRQDHSVFYATRKVTEPGYEVPYTVNEYDRNRVLFLDYVQAQKDAVARMNAALLADRAGERNVFLFGAHVFSQLLLVFGLDTSRIVGILDNDTAKHGKRLYGTSYRVLGVESLRDAHRPVVVLRAGAYRDEIVRGILKIRSDVVLIE